MYKLTVATFLFLLMLGCSSEQEKQADRLASSWLAQEAAHKAGQLSSWTSSGVTYARYTSLVQEATFAFHEFERGEPEFKGTLFASKLELALEIHKTAGLVWQKSIKTSGLVYGWWGKNLAKMYPEIKVPLGKGGASLGQDSYDGDTVVRIIWQAADEKIIEMEAALRGQQEE